MSCPCENHEFRHVLKAVALLAVALTEQRVGTISGLDHWTGLLDWTTGLARIAVKRLLVYIEAF